MDRRTALKLSALSSISLGLSSTASADSTCATDGTPAQFIPKSAPDSRPEVEDIAKQPKCPYCGMDRKQFHHSRMVVHYADDLADSTCSLHCAAISLSLNIDRDPKALWVGDNAATDAIKPLVEVDQASFLIGSKQPGVMTTRSKIAYGNADAARAAQAEHGGEIADFNAALLAAYTDMSADVARIRKNRAERRQKMHGHGH
ncbi:MAG: nitrous oxide reductase accessory protein NosL [Thauera sp.]|jgi:nitrous oxide reductase accessory protein NosL|nr:nitrous oxide reductase accessory protein NosL [Thauera sp.]